MVCPVGEAVGSQSEGHRVGPLDGRVQRVDRIHDGHRSEGFLLHDPGMVGHVGQDRRLVEVAGVADPVATGGQGASRGARVGDQVAHRGEAPIIGHRTHLDTGLQARTHHGRLAPAGDPFEELLVDGLVDEEASG